MELPGSRLSALCAVLGMGLCVAMVTGAPMASESFDDDVPQHSVHATAQDLQSVVHLLHSLIALDNMRNSGQSQSLFERAQSRKRGFGIAGLDNVDMITSTLDRSRSFARPRQSPVMSPGLSIHQLRELMRKAG